MEDMRRVLDVKERTHGLNTDLLGGRNLHIWLKDLVRHEMVHMLGMIAVEKRPPQKCHRVPFEERISKLDMHHAVWEVERMTRFVSDVDLNWKHGNTDAGG
jgi:hypothetical protein